MATRTTLFACTLLAGSLSLGACSNKTVAPPKPTIALVEAPASDGYGSFNDGASAGLSACERVARITTSTVLPSSPAEYEPQVTLLATENVDTIVGIGFQIAPAVARAARRFEKTHFALIDAVVDEPNVESITFKEQEGAFLAGALAAMLSKHGSIAFLGGADVPLLRPYEAGYVAGAKQIDPRIRVRVAYAGSFTDPDAARNLASSLYRSGSDIIFVVAGSAGLGAIEATKSRAGDYAIGADTNQDGLAPGKVLTSVVKRVDDAVSRACLETVAQKPASGHVELGLASGGIALTPFTYTRATIGAARIARLERLREAIVAGSIVPPQTRSGAASYRPVSL